MFTNVTTKSQIANALKISVDKIIEVQEWASVLWVKYQGGCRFVSKKVVSFLEENPFSHEPKNPFGKILGFAKPIGGYRWESWLETTEFQGSEKQIKWAKDIARRSPSIISNFLDKGEQPPTSAKWWIDYCR